MSNTNHDLGALLRAHPLVDGHNDWALVLRKLAGSGVDGLDGSRPELQTDLPRLRQGGVGGQFWASSVSAGRPEPETTVDALEQIDLIYRFIEQYPDVLQVAYTAADVRRIHGEGRIASLLALEGGHQISNSLGVLRAFARLGVRYLTLTHFTSTSWADSSTDVARASGLSEVGLAIVRELNRLGVIVDVSHVADTTAAQAIAYSTSPVIFSHSSARAVAGHVRNAPDEVLATLPANGGVVHATFVPSFISDRVGEWYAAYLEERQRLELPARADLWPTGVIPGQTPVEAAEAHRARLAGTVAQRADSERGIADWLAANPRPEATLLDVVAHVEHLREVVGIAHIGIGSDFDGSPDQPRDLEDVSAFPRLLGALRERNWSDDDLVAFAGGNTLRVLQANEEAATEPLWPNARR